MRFTLITIALLIVFIIAQKEYPHPPKLSKDFLWGVATSAYQIEGAADADGKGKSIWDWFSHLPNKTKNGDNGDVACDHYNKYKTDVTLLKEMGVKAYRFSLAWSRILPTGRPPINQKGIDFYNNLINELRNNGIEPMITLYHWDFPLQLYEEYRGWIDPKSVEDFVEYAKIVFDAFGDRVRYWITFNEPHIVSVHGHDYGSDAPGRCSDRSKCTEGDSDTEPYLAAHHMLLSHAKAVEYFRQKGIKGQIGITLNGDWAEPRSDSANDKEAAERYLEFMIGWFADPVFKGDYPQSMKDRVKERLPTFKPEESELLKGSSDFLGLNHYSSRYIEDTTTPVNPVGWLKDASVRVETTSNNGTLIGKQMCPDWLISVPWGFKKLLLYLHNKYEVPIYVTENGVAEDNDPNIPKEEAIKDEHRIEYYSEYLHEMAEAIKEGANIKGYLAWSFLDNFEWVNGYSVRFGLYWIDFKGNLERVAKNSVTWWKDLLSQYQPTFLEKYGIVLISAIIGVAAIGILILMAIYFGLKYIVDKKRQYQGL